MENLTNGAQPTVIYPRWSITFALIFCAAFILIGVCGNVLTILALLRHRKLRAAPTTVFIVSLSVADLIFCSFNLPITAVRYAYRKWVLGDLLCKLFPFFFYLNVASSLFNMMGISINRYILIAHYMKYDKVYRRPYLFLMIVACWAFPLILLLPTLAEKWGKFGYQPHTFSCTILRDAANGGSPKKFLFLLGFFLPCIVIVICYGCIFRVVRRTRRNMASHEQSGLASPKSLRGEDENRTLTRMVAVIFLAFLVCYLPLMSANVFDENDMFPGLHVVASVLAWSASVINPIIYGFMSKKYRQAYSALLPWLPKRRGGVALTTATSSSGVRNSITAFMHGNVVRLCSSETSDAKFPEI